MVSSTRSKSTWSNGRRMSRRIRKPESKGLERLMEEGAWEADRRAVLRTIPHRAHGGTEIEGASVDAESGIITKDGVGIGIQQEGRAVRGFATPSRKFEIRSLFIQKIGKNENCSELIAKSGVTRTKNRPKQSPRDTTQTSIPCRPGSSLEEHQQLADNELIMTSFKWNVHNHGRTMNLKWLAEIVHTNPAWINPKTAAKFGLSDGDWIELTSYYSKRARNTISSPETR